MMSRTGGWGLLAVVLVVLAACGRSVGGEATAAGGTDGQPLTLASFGDLRTLDPCGLVSTSAFAEHGDAHPLAREWFDDCTFAVGLGAENVRVDFGLVRSAAAVPGERRQLAMLGRGASVVRTSTDDDSSCEVHLLLSDGAGIRVGTDVLDYDSEISTDTLCSVARTGAEAIFLTLDSGRVPHWDPPANSLARLSACSLLSPADVASRLGVSPDDVTLYPAEHQCRWGVGGGDASTAKFDLLVGNPLDFGDGRAEDIAGRRTLVEETNTESVRVCTISTEHIAFADAVENEREIAVVRVLHPADEHKNACETGRALAKQAWPKLPPR